MKQHRAFFDTSSALGTACFQVSLMFMFILILTNVCLLLPLYSLLHMPNPQVCGSHHLVAPFPELCIQHLWKSCDNCPQGGWKWLCSLNSPFPEPGTPLSAHFHLCSKSKLLRWLQKGVGNPKEVLPSPVLHRSGVRDSPSLPSLATLMLHVTGSSWG